jgi:hypothetical protein
MYFSLYLCSCTIVDEAERKMLLIFIRYGILQLKVETVHCQCFSSKSVTLPQLTLSRSLDWCRVGCFEILYRSVPQVVCARNSQYDLAHASGAYFWPVCSHQLSPSTHTMT